MGRDGGCHHGVSGSGYEPGEGVHGCQYGFRLSGFGQDAFLVEGICAESYEGGELCSGYQSDGVF